MTIPSFFATLSPCPAICSNWIRLQVFFNRQQSDSTSTIVSTAPVNIAPTFYRTLRISSIALCNKSPSHSRSALSQLKSDRTQITRLVNTCSHTQKDLSTVLLSSQDASKSSASESQVGAIRVRMKQSTGGRKAVDK